MPRGAATRDTSANASVSASASGSGSGSGTVERELERAQKQVMELLFQQCATGGDMSTSTGHSSEGERVGRANAALALNNGDDGGGGGALDEFGDVHDLLMPSHEETASLMDFLADSCSQLGDKLEELSPADVAVQLAEAVAATQKSLRRVQESAQQCLEDPEKMRALCQHFEAADEQVRLLQEQHAEDLRLHGDGHQQQQPRYLANSTVHDDSEGHHSDADEEDEVELPLVLASKEETLRNMMQFTDNMCTVVDSALSTITKDEYALAAQLSLSLAHKLLQAGQSLFTSLGDENRQKAYGHSDRSDRITIEELGDEGEDVAGRGHDGMDPASKRKLSGKSRKCSQKQVAVLRTHLETLMEQARAAAMDRPVVAAMLGTASLPFIGLAVPVASMVGLAVVLENYFPEHASLTIEMCSNFMQMSKLWFLLLKISARQFGVVATECFKSWHQHASQHGYLATGVELASTGWTVGCFGVSWLYSSAMGYYSQRRVM